VKALLYYLDEFQLAQIDKFVKRISKHPNELSVTDDRFDWRNQHLGDIENHLRSEFFERFPDIINDLKPEVIEANKQFFASITKDEPETEDIDIANLSAVDWIIRKVRSSSDGRIE